MGNFYLISKSFDPGAASTIHALSIVRGLDEHGLKATWVFIFPNSHSDKFDGSFKNITIKYLWKDSISQNKLLRQIYKHISYARFFYSLKEGDSVLLFGSKIYLKKLSNRKDITVFQELTEHPAVGKMSRLPFYSYKNYFKWAQKIDGVFVMTNALRQSFIAYGIKEDKVHVINMVVDNKRFDDVNTQKEGKPYIGYCGNASNTKDGVDDLIRAFAIISYKFHDIRLRIIGPKPQLGSINDKLVKELNIVDRVDFIGSVPPSAIPQLLVNAQIVALARPSSLQNKYGFPSKLGEYLLSGNPVCVTAVGDIPLFLTHKVSALLSPCGDYKAFARNLEWCLDNFSEAKQIGQRGRAVALQNFNYLIETKKMINIICSNEDGQTN